MNYASTTVLDATHVVNDLSAPDPGLLFNLSHALGFMVNQNNLGAGLVTAPGGTGLCALDTSKTCAGASWPFTR